MGRGGHHRRELQPRRTCVQGNAHEISPPASCHPFASREAQALSASFGSALGPARDPSLRSGCQPCGSERLWACLSHAKNRNAPIMNEHLAKLLVPSFSSGKQGSQEWMKHAEHSGLGALKEFVTRASCWS